VSFVLYYFWNVPVQYVDKMIIKERFYWVVGAYVRNFT